MALPSVSGKKTTELDHGKIMPKRKPPKIKLGMEAMPSWLYPPKLIPPETKHTRVVNLGISKEQIERDYQQARIRRL